MRTLQWSGALEAGRSWLTTSTRAKSLVSSTTCVGNSRADHTSAVVTKSRSRSRNKGHRVPLHRAIAPIVRLPNESIR